MNWSADYGDIDRRITEWFSACYEEFVICAAKHWESAAHASEPWSTLDNVLQMGSNGEVVLCSKLQAIAIRDAHNKDILGTKRIPFYGGVLGK